MVEPILRVHAPGPEDENGGWPASSIHPTAIVSRYATIGQGVSIGPYVVVEGDAVIGDGCRLEAHVVIKEGTILGPNNHICEGAILGGLPQHVHMPEHPGKVIIGAGNVIREHVTIHRALDENEATVVGDNNLLMVNAHVAHDCRLGNHCILANNVMLAGHVTVGDRAYLSGAVAVHQFCRIGTLAMVGGHARVGKDIPVCHRGRVYDAGGGTEYHRATAGGFQRSANSPTEGSLPHYLPQPASLAQYFGDSSYTISRWPGGFAVFVFGDDNTRHHAGTSSLRGMACLRTGRPSQRRIGPAHGRRGILGSGPHPALRCLRFDRR